MKIARFVYKKNFFWGVLEGEFIRVLKEAPFRAINFTREKILYDKVKLLPPSIPTKIVLVGLNYKDHAKELNMEIPREPIIFLKPPTSLIGDGENIIYPPGVKRLDYEGELALVIKKEGKNIKEKNVTQYILGFTCLNDITARDLQAKDGQWTRAKSFDTFCPVGPLIETDVNPSNLYIRTYLNGKLKQDSNTSNFIFPVRHIVSFVSNIMTLMPGDIISTGTPAGIGEAKIGNFIEIEIEKIGRLKNKIVK